jgi:hypothetical protein
MVRSVDRVFLGQEKEVVVLPSYAMLWDHL